MATGPSLQPIPGNNPYYPGAGSTPTAPTAEAIPGYDSGFLSGSELAPPSYEESLHNRSATARSIGTNIPTVSEEEARTALIDEVSHHCCYGKTAAQQLDIVGLDTNTAFHYVLDTFTEARSSNWTVEPYQGQVIDGPHNGPASQPWDIQVLPQHMFENASTCIEVPHTASVKPCHICAGTGRGVCSNCNGTSWARCHTCHGQGHITINQDGRSLLQPCRNCQGNGNTHCMVCNGSGTSVCKTCSGRAQLKSYIKLTVTWRIHTDERFFVETDLPSELIKKARGVVAFEEEAPLAVPLSHFCESAVNSASHTLVSSHRNRWPNERILSQRQVVRIVPITKVHFVWKSKQGSYFVYGIDHCVYAPRYPQRCCGRCNIL